MTARWLKPNWLTLIFAGVLATVIVVMLGSSRGSVAISQGSRVESVILVGVGPSLEYRTVTEADQVVDSGFRIHWHWLILNVLALYVAGAALSRLVTSRIRPRQPAALFLSVIASTLVLALIAAVAVSRVMWGYCFVRPSLDPRVRDFVEILSVTPVRSERQDAEDTVFAIDRDRSIREAIERGRSDPYYCLGARILVALEDSGKLPGYPRQLPAATLQSLYGRLARTGVLREGDAGYDDATMLSGFAVEAADSDGERYLFFGGTGRQVSNDHYPCYEFLFKVPHGSGDPALLSWNRFYYDVAGMEGMEWYAMFAIFSCLGLIVTVPGTIAVLGSAAAMRARKGMQR